MNGPDLLTRYRTAASEEAFAELVRRYANLVYSVARRRLSNGTLAEEVTQTVFTRLAKAVPKIKTDGELVAWLHRTAVHVAIFHVIAWKVFFALQPQDWFVRVLHLPIVELDDATRSRNSMLSNGAAFLFSNLVAYLLNIYWVFVPGRHRWIVEVGLFYLVSGTAIVIGTWVMGILIRRFGMLTTYAFGANLFAALMINYVMRKFFIFNG